MKIKKWFNDRKEAECFRKEFDEFKRLAKSDSRAFAMNESELIRIAGQNKTHTSFDRGYFMHTAWAARILAKSGIKKHVDISSFVYFVGVLSAFMEVDYYEYRPINVSIPGLNCLQADLCALPFDDRTVESLSCMHTIEHVGLGRYGDPLDPRGDVKAMNELNRVLAPKGRLLLVVPLGGRAHIRFHAHRVYTKQLILASFPDLVCEEFSYLPDKSMKAELLLEPTDDFLLNQKEGLGCFSFRKPA